MSTAPKNAFPTRKGKEHGGSPIKNELVISKITKNLDLVKSNTKLVGRKCRPRSKRSKTGVDLIRPEIPPNRVVTQPIPVISGKRRGFAKTNCLHINQKGESLRKLRFRINTLSMSKSSIERACNPLYALKHLFKSNIFENAPIWIQQKISNLLVGGLVFTKHPVGISLSKNIQMVVASPSPYCVKRIVSCLPFWPTSYTMQLLYNIASLLKQSRRIA